MDGNELSGYLDGRARSIAGKLIRNNMLDIRETAFLLRFRRTMIRDEKIRAEHEKNGLHVPIFLISSITTSCNLFCKGCYARSEHICGSPIRTEMSSDDWESVFDQAESLGIPFNILAGGEPMMRPEVIRLAAGHKDTVFPIFTNGTMINAVSIDMLSRHRNLIPVLSLEGGKDRTDTRRGAGTYDSVIEKMDELKKNGLFFGTSVTVTKENMNEVLSDDFITGLDETGCGIVLFIEYVPVGGCMAEIAPDTESRKVFDARLKRIRKEHRGMVFMSFPGDERNTGGCLGAGRGFFHINPYGDAEACPASPHSDVNIMNGTVEDALRSRLFSGIRADRLLSAEHDGGCALIQNSDRVAAIIDECTERTTSG